MSQVSTVLTLEFKKLTAGAVAPVRGSADAAGYDLCCIEDFTLQPGEQKLVKTGIAVALPYGYYGQLASRSGLCVKEKILTQAGVIDSDYRGEIGVVLYKLPSATNITAFKAGDRITQMIVLKHEAPFVFEVADLSNTNRASGGFGSTGI